MTPRRLCALLWITACGGAPSGSHAFIPTDDEPLVASVAVSAGAFHSFEDVTANADGSTGTGINGYRFDWGDGSPATHAYPAPGTFAISVVVTDGRRVSPPATASITILPARPPVVRLNWPGMVMPGDDVVIDASASTSPDGHIVSYEFSFAEGETIVQASPLLHYSWAKAGVYGLDVTATDNHGGKGHDSRGVTIGEKLSLTKVPSETRAVYRSDAYMARDAAGNIDVIWLEEQKIAFSRSTDGGASFALQQLIVDGPGPWEAQFLNSAIAVSPGGAIHVVFTLWNRQTGQTDFGYVRSPDGGKTFTPPVLFDPAIGSSTFAPSVAVKGEDQVEVAWIRQDDASQALISQLAYSADGGHTFKAGAQLHGRDVDCPVSMAYSGNTLLAVWHGGEVVGANLARSVQFAYSNDQGATFSAPVILDAEPHNWCPQLAVGGARAAVVWDRGDIAERQQVMVAVSDDEGKTWSPPRVASSTVDSAKCSSGALDPSGNLYVVYSGNAFGAYYTRLRVSSDAGRTFGPPLPAPFISENGWCMKVAAPSAGRVNLLWNDPFNGMQDVFLAYGVISVP